MPKTRSNALGQHLILELFECPTQLLQKPQQSRSFLLDAAKAMGATVVSDSFHAFSPHGVSGVVIIQESHLTIHTWPEHSYAAIDIFTCGHIDLTKGAEYLVERFQASRWEVKEIARGPATMPKSGN